MQVNKDLWRAIVSTPHGGLATSQVGGSGGLLRGFNSTRWISNEKYPPKRKLSSTEVSTPHGGLATATTMTDWLVSTWVSTPHGGLATHTTGSTSIH